MHLSEEEGAEITFSGRKLSVKSAAFPFVRPPVFPSLRTRARPSSRDPSVRLSPPLRQSLVRSPFAFPAREKSTRVYAKQRRSLPVSPGTGSRGKIPCCGAFFFRGGRRTGGDGTAALIHFFASLCRDPLRRLDAVWTYRVQKCFEV